MSEKRCYTVKELQEILGVSRPTILLVAEAIWPRYMPSRKIVDHLLAGGALLDLTVYPITSALMTFHGEVVDIIDGSGQRNMGIKISL